MPDTFSNSKWELFCEAIQRMIPQYAPEMDQVYVWLDVACVPSEHVARAEAEAKRLGLKFGEGTGVLPEDTSDGSSSSDGDGDGDRDRDGVGDGGTDREKKLQKEEESKREREDGRVATAAAAATRAIDAGPGKATYARKAAGTTGVLGTAATAGTVGTSAAPTGTVRTASSATTAGLATASGTPADGPGKLKADPAAFVPKGPKPPTKQEIRQQNRERGNDPDVSLGKQLNMSSMSQWGLLLFDRVMMYMDCMLTVVSDEGYRAEPWALSNSGLGMHYDYKAKNWQRYLSRRWCRLEMAYCANIPFLPEEEYQVCMYVTCVL